ncbi:UNVERIFIED_CONTAM: hypothetical protein PYX00_003092 [Menopon gallinae]|uniref:C2H2-type domain-containing protein n=1 Tax=Menopon gallinae TaxID=328185 RepID=A0AAW2I027_9NEOP
MDQSTVELRSNEYMKEREKNVGDDKDMNYPDSDDSPIKSNTWGSSVNNQIGKRKLHKSYIVTWSTQISQNGFAKCLIETCNFISLDIQIIQEHYRICDGVQNLETNVCSFCKYRLSSEGELIIHKSKCKGRVQGGFTGTDNTDENLRGKRCDVQSQISECSESWIKSSAMDKTNASFNEIVYCEQCNQGFLTEEEFSHHSQSCKQLPKTVVPRKRDRSMCTSVILKNRINKEFDENCIIQPGRDIPKGQYVRRRGYTKQHKSIWEAAIEKCKYVKCIFQNCHFLGLSVEDMISHFGYCNGDGSFARYVCPYCEGRVTSEKYLEIHIRRSHNDVINSHFLDMETESPREMLNCASTYVDDNEVRDKEVKMESAGCDYGRRAVPQDILYSENDNTGNEELSERAFQPDCESSYVLSDANCIQDGAAILPDDQSGELNTSQKVQYLKSNCCYKDDHIYFKRKGRVAAADQETDPSLLVMKNSNLRHYSGPRNATDRPAEKDQETHVQEGEGENKEVPENKRLEGEDSEKENVKRKVHQYYTTSWAESIKKNGFARCLVATCNFISLDIFHIQNHFKTCNGVPANGPNLCTFCGSRLPSATELSVHSSKCKAYSEDNFSSEIPCLYEDSLDERQNDGVEDTSKGNTDENGTGGNTKTQESSSEAVMDKEVGPDKCQNSEPSPEISSKKEKVTSLRISDIIKLKDNGNADSNRIIQPGPDLPEGQYLRRRAYTKRHKAIWESALEKHKYVKCIFQNCHFLAMSLEDMIYHFGYCIGDGSFAKFECPHCKGRVTSQSVLDVHIRVSHSEKPAEESVNHVEENEDCNVDEEYPSLAELKKIVTRKEIKTYARNSARSRTTRSAGSDMVVKVEPFGLAENISNENSVDVNNSVSESPKSGSGDNHKGPEGSDRTNVNEEPSDIERSKSGVEEMEICEGKNPGKNENSGRRGRPRSSENTNKRTQESVSRSGRKSKPGDVREDAEHNKESVNDSAILEASPEKEEEPSVKRMKTEESEVKTQPRRRGRPPKKTDDSEVPEVVTKPKEKPVPEPKGKRGRKRTVPDDEEEPVKSAAEEVTCAKCSLKVKKHQFKEHNMKKHVGLSWIDGENPIDPNDEETVSRNVKQAFKFVKSGTCERCGVVKKSALGFISHVQNCGKSEEEKEALKVTCPYCPSRILKYSLPMHLKLSHSEPAQEVEKPKDDAGDESQTELPSKRRSAIRAVNKFHEVLKQCNDDEDLKSKDHYVLFRERGIEIPETSSQSERIVEQNDEGEQKDPVPPRELPRGKLKLPRCEETSLPMLGIAGEVVRVPALRLLHHHRGRY